jgi:glucokinase
MSEIIAGIDIGGTKIAAATAYPDGRIIRKETIPTKVEKGPHEILECTMGMVSELVRNAQGGQGELTAIGVGCAGPLDVERGLILSPPNLPGWDEFPLVALLKDRFRVRVVLENDANAAALGEQRFGAGRGFENLVYITISTGIGGGVIVDRRIVRGVGSGAGEVGHMTILPDGPPCGCGSRGCLETLCSGTGIARRAREALAQGAESILSAYLSNKSDGITAAKVVEAARNGDRLAAALWSETIRYLALGVGNIIAMLAPEAIIFGGGVSTVGEQLLRPLRQRLNEQVRMAPVEDIHLLQAGLGPESGLYGAISLVADADRNGA